MNVLVIGAGYVGLVSAACFAKFGAKVTCVDTDEHKIEQLNLGAIPIYEPGLELLIESGVKLDRLSFQVASPKPVADADLIFLAVGTPARQSDGHADLAYVYAAVEHLAVNLKGYTLIVDKSTVPVGTAKQVVRIIKGLNPEADFDVASNPEFMREGTAIEDFLQPDRIVLGLETEKARRLLLDLYSPLISDNIPLVTTNLESAELIKYASNAFLATKISFINEMSQLCEAVGADVTAVALGMGLDARIGTRNLQAGPGFGGSCFPKDILALSRLAQEHGTSCKIVESVVEVNATQKAKMVQKIRNALGGEVGKHITILGLTFKPDTDDMRDAPALAIIPPLIDMG
ncbi:MAG: UDP-glucose/GDP-mannose dehydrogenase family protein, partial [Immundisolibacteraceae bacterium]|nr:UDP-glucose/GDP-mannose dehydrogenase family protein [Immundisolibacteraceae bacterium]